jgi:hypothetical protein
LFYPALLAQKRDKKTEFNNLWIIITKKVYCLTLLQPRKEATTGTTIYCQTILLHHLKATRLHHKISKLLKAFDSNKLNSFDKIAFDIMSLHKTSKPKGKIPFEYMPYSV